MRERERESTRICLREENLKRERRKSDKKKKIEESRRNEKINKAEPSDL